MPVQGKNSAEFANVREKVNQVMEIGRKKKTVPGKNQYWVRPGTAGTLSKETATDKDGLCSGQLWDVLSDLASFYL